jgi:hypothetical protein
MRRPFVTLASLLASLLLATCGGAPERRGEPADDAARGAQFRAIDRAYLQVRREERSCKDLQGAADAAFTQRLHAPALDADELLIAFCPPARLPAVEQTQVVLARTEARSGGPTGRSVRLRLTLPLPPAHRLLWWSAVADGMFGLNNLPVGKHRVEVEMHIWQRGAEPDDPASGQMVRVTGAVDVHIDGRTPVMLDADLVGGAGRPGTAQTPLALNLTPSQQSLPPGTTTGLEMEGNHPTGPAELARSKIPFPDPPEPLGRVGLPASVDLELCFDAAGRVSRVDPLAWPHPRYLASYVEGLRRFKMKPFVRNGVPVPFCTGWRQIVEQAAVSQGR